MTSYDGKCLSFVPGREVVNREPPVSKFVVEKLYRVHRTRVLECESVVDCHMVVPNFLTNQTWKQLAAKHQENIILQHNEAMFERIAKVENEESSYTKETREHIKRVKHKAKYMKHLKEVGRMRKLLKIQKENEHMAKRLEKARPEYSLKNCKEWYKYHESFKNGRRSDPTAGHIMKGMKGLLPSSLPPLESSTYSIKSLDAIPSPDMFASIYDTGSLSPVSVYSSKLAALRGLPSLSNSASMIGSMDSETFMNSSGFMNSSTTMNAVEARLRATSLNRKKKSQSNVNSDAFEVESDLDSDYDDNDANNDDYDKEIGEQVASSRQKTVKFEDFNNGDDTSSLGSVESHLAEIEHMESKDDKIVLLSRQVAIPNDNKNCIIQICVNRVYDENLYIKIFSTTIPPKLYSERPVSIDLAYDIIAEAQESSANIARVAGNDDMHSLRALLIDMFKEADNDGNGYLTFDEFQDLMEKVDLGISPQELRFVISEADENENGVVDYHEFVPLAVDLIQSFRARNRAKSMDREAGDILDDQIMRALSQQELHELTVDCLRRVQDHDVKKYGVIRSNDLKRCLSANPPLGLTETEISLICQMLPRDPFGRCVYSTFEDVLRQVRFLTMKNAIIESQGSHLQRYLLDLCKEEEARLRHLQGGAGGPVCAVDDSVHGSGGGLLPFRSIVTLLCNSPRLSLSRLQVMVIMSEASVLDGMINYYQFVPVVAKTIELMFEPKTLRQRAELIETTDLSPEALLQGMTSEMFEQRLRTLFKSYDVDHNAILDEAEFVACLESLDLQLTKGEMTALMATADVRGSGSLAFEEFVQFFTHNLIHLEREKHIRLLQKSLKGNEIGQDDNNGKTEMEKYKEHLTSIFTLADTDNSGQLHHQEIVDVLKSLEVNISQFELDILLSELDTNGSGLISYKQFIPSCAELLRAFRANEKAQESRLEKEKWAESKASKLVQASLSDVHHIVRYLKERIHLVEETVEDPLARVTTMQEVLRNPHSGLSRTESNLLLGKLFTTSSSSSMSSTSHKHSNSNNNTNSSSNAANSNSHHEHKSHSNVNSSQHSRHHRHPVLKSNLSHNELQAMVIEVRKQSIMRNLLEDLNPDSLRSTILKQIEMEYQRFKENQRSLEEIASGNNNSNENNNNNGSNNNTHHTSIDHSNENLCPIEVCYAALEKCPNLRLHRGEIIAIISLSNCHDASGMLMDINKFSDHASAVIAKINEAEFVENTAAVLDRGGVDEKKVMNGLRTKEIEDYFHSEFSRREEVSSGTVSREVFLEVVKRLPKVSLSDSEAIAVTASLTSSTSIVHGNEHNAGIDPGDTFHSGDTFQANGDTSHGNGNMTATNTVRWREFMPLAAETIKSLLKERVLRRRVMLYAATEGSDTESVTKEEALGTMKQLAERFIDFVKVRIHFDSVVVVLPDDRGGGQHHGDRSRRSDKGNSDDNEAENDSGSHGGMVLAKAAVMLPMLSRSWIDLQGDNLSHAMVVHNIKTKGKKQPHFPALVTVLVADGEPQSERDVSIRVTNVEATLHQVISVPMKLPSIAILDMDVGEEFARNLVERVYIEYKDELDRMNVSKLKVAIIP